MNEEKIEELIRRVLTKMFMDNLDAKDILEARIIDIMDYIKNDCVCANYNQKHRSKLVKKLTGKNQTFKYTGA